MNDNDPDNKDSKDWIVLSTKIARSWQVGWNFNATRSFKSSNERGHTQNGSAEPFRDRQEIGSLEMGFPGFH